MNNKGFTFIEIIMIIVILGIIMPGVMLYFIQGVKNSADSQRRVTATFLSEGLMEEIRSKGWDEVTPINATCSNASVIGADGEARNAYDDIDDFNGMNNTPPANSQGAAMADYPGFTQQVTVMYVDPANLDAPAAMPPTCYKRIEVRIVDVGTNETIRLVSLMTGY